MPRLRRLRRDAHVARLAGAIYDPIIRLRFLRAAAPRPASRRRRILRWIIWTVFLVGLLVPFLIKRAAGKPEPLHVMPAAPRQASAGDEPRNVSVWLVEVTGDSEVYSNGLRIDTRYTVSNRNRAYTAFERAGAAAVKKVRRTDPAGIVFHTTESCQAPFEEEETEVLKRLGESLLEYVHRRRAYHYVIDRFGRVYRVVAESDTAYHAGYSVWADDERFYVNLNESFFGVSFEAQSQPAAPDLLISPAQIRAAAMLTEMLRSRYHLPAGNCVTHAQVSVNPSNMMVGYHTDWATDFPFAAIGLPDNYRIPLPSLWAFGFSYEPAGPQANGEGVATGVALAVEEIAKRAAAAHMRPVAYQKALREQYRKWLADVRHPALASLSFAPRP